MLMKKLLRLVGTTYPMVQVPMAGSDNSAMTAAASELECWSLGAQYRTPEQIRATVRNIRDLTLSPFSVNLLALPQAHLPSTMSIESAIESFRPY